MPPEDKEPRGQIAFEGLFRLSKPLGIDAFQALSKMWRLAARLRPTASFTIADEHGKSAFSSPAQLHQHLGQKTVSTFEVRLR